MSRPAVSAQHVGKIFQLGDRIVHDTLRDHIAAVGRAIFSRRSSGEREAAPATDTAFRALDDVSFEIMPGETVGIIGRNGAGKSTLLKILSQISEPTSGEIRVRGRLAALLEVGAGFHPELTGRENVYLNGSILGMSRAEIRKKFDEIVAFAEVEKFLDTPVKRYSSGMHVRLAFAVAAHLEADIMVVDEVLAVGDAAFQAKCLRKMGDITTSEGRTILFVSHNLAAVQRLCSRGLYLEAGRLKVDAPVYQALDAYQRAFDQTVENPQGWAEPLLGKVNVVRWHLENSSTGDPHTCQTRETCVFVISLASGRTDLDCGVSFIIWNLEGTLIFHGHLWDEKCPPFTLEKGLCEIRVTLRLPVKAGLYQLEFKLYSKSDGAIESALLEPKLHILPGDVVAVPQWQGMITEVPSFAIVQKPTPAIDPS
ncbi:MAG: polysaccharide ABC transporter ATP-binding protein [Chthoniobacter sp.]|nr:polysaccharide ABC transporter ATP-binding protein [Chthoniobacter sp.]